MKHQPATPKPATGSSRITLTLPNDLLAVLDAAAVGNRRPANA